MTKVMPIPHTVGRAVCADPQHLPLVDAAHAKPGGPEAQEMKRLCRTCPVIETCFTWAMTHAETGVWGGVSPRVRSDHGAPKRLATVSDAFRRQSPTPGQPRDTSGYKTSATTLRLAELGVTEGAVKRWAHEHGLARTLKGRASLAQVEAYARATA